MPGVFGIAFEDYDTTAPRGTYLCVDKRINGEVSANAAADPQSARALVIAVRSMVMCDRFFVRYSGSNIDGMETERVHVTKAFKPGSACWVLVSHT